MKEMRVALVTHDYCVGLLEVSLDEEERLTESDIIWQGGREAEEETMYAFFTSRDGMPLAMLSGNEWRTLEDRGMTDWFYQEVFDDNLEEALVDLRRIMTAQAREGR